MLQSGMTIAVENMQAMADPSMLAKVVQANPAARAIMESNPRLHQLMSSPEAMQGLLQGADACCADSRLQANAGQSM